MAPLPVASPAPTEFRSRLDALLRAQALPPEKYGHQPRLYALTRQVGAHISYDDDVVYAAAYLHDLGVFIGHRPEEPERLSTWDHVAYTVEHAPGILVSCGFPAHKIEAVLEAIRTHQPKDDPSTLEGVLLRDADILEQLGAIGILRTIAKVGRDTRFPSFTSAVASLERSLQMLPSCIRLPHTRTLAEPRIELLRAFLAGAREESLTHLH